LEQVRLNFTDEVKLSTYNTNPKIFLVNEKDKNVRIPADNSATSLFKWHGIYFDNTQNFVQVKLRIRIEESRGSTEPLQNPTMDIDQDSGSDIDLTPMPTPPGTIVVNHQGDVTVQAPVAAPVRPQQNQNNFDDIRKVFQGCEYSLTDENLQEVARVTNYDVSKAAIVRQAVELSEDQNFEDILRVCKEKNWNLEAVIDSFEE